MSVGSKVWELTHPAAVKKEREVTKFSVPIQPAGSDKSIDHGQNDVEDLQDGTATERLNRKIDRAGG